MKRPEREKEPTTRGDSARHGRLVVSFVDRNWFWSRFGLGLSLVLAAVIAALALMPLPDGVPDWHGLDKFIYFVAFLVLVFPVIVTDTSRWSWVLPAAIAYGGVIELIQPFMGRNADWLDFAAGISGVLAGAALAEILHNRIRRAVLGPDSAQRTDLPLSTEYDRLESLRGELMVEFRAVLRQELEAAALRRDDRRAAPGAGAVEAGHGDTPDVAEIAARPAPGGTHSPLPPQPPTPPSPQPRPSRPLSSDDMPLRVSPLRPAESGALRRAKSALRAMEDGFDPFSDTPDAMTPKAVPPRMPPPNLRPSGTRPPDARPDGGAPTRH